jgi:hypothetical protein
VKLSCLPRLKGMDHEMNIFLKAYKTESVVYVHALLVLKFLGCLVEEKIFHASMKTLTISKDCYENHIIISVPAYFSVSGWFSPVSTLH